MSLKKEIQKALLLNKIKENDTVVIKTDKVIIFSLNLLKMLTLLILNFATQMQMTNDDVHNFIMNNIDEILDTVITELEIVLFDFANLCDEEFEDVIELHCRDECFLILAMKDKVNKKLKKFKEK